MLTFQHKVMQRRSRPVKGAEVQVLVASHAPNARLPPALLVVPGHAPVH